MFVSSNQQYRYAWKVMPLIYVSIARVMLVIVHFSLMLRNTTKSVQKLTYHKQQHEHGKQH